GQTVHLAARMEQLATPGGILLTPATLRLVEGLIQVHALGPIPVKGLVEPVEVAELGGVSGLRRRLQGGGGGGRTRAVGGEAGAGVWEGWGGGGGGHGEVVAVVGEAGVGKSRLLYEFVHWRDCVGAGRSPFPATASAEGAQFNVPPSHHPPGWLVLESASV